MTDIRVEHADTKREGIDHFRILQVAVHAHNRLCTAVGEQAVKTVVGIVIHDTADALVLLFLHHLLLLDVIDFQTAHLRIVRGIDKALAITVECYVGRVIELDAVDVVQPLLLTGLQVNLRHVCKVARSIHGGVCLLGSRVIDEWRHRTQRLFGQRLGCCDGILADGGEVLFLMLLLVLLPVIPYFSEGLSIDFLKLFAEEGATVGRSVIELDHLLVAVGLGEVVHETGTIEIGIGAHLEVLCGAFRFQAYYRIELVALVDDTAEIHLVIAP